MPKKGNQGEKHRQVSIKGIKPLPPLKEPLICENPECSLPGKKFWAKWSQKRQPPRHCSTTCRLRHNELLRGKCSRAACENYVKNRGDKYCSQNCRMLVISVPRKKCARLGCGNMTHNGHAKYCSLACWEQCIDYKEMGEKGRKMIEAHKTIKGTIPKAEKISTAVRKNNQVAPPRRKMQRTGKAYGYDVLFEPESGQYRVSVPALPGIITRHKQKRGALLQIRSMMREQGIASLSQRTKPSPL